MATYNVLKHFYTLRQKENETVEAYHKRFQATVDTIEMSLGNLFGHPELLAHEASNFDHNTKADAIVAMKSKFLATSFIQGADPKRFGGLWRDLKNSMILGQDNYPHSLPTAYDILQNYKSSSVSRTENPDVRVSFLQTENDVTSANTNPDYVPVSDYSNIICPDGQSPVPGRNRLCFPNLRCFSCNRYGHTSRFCDQMRNVQGLQMSTTFAQSTSDSDMIPKSWLLLDSGSTISSVCNRNLLSNLEFCTEPLKVHCNGGSCIYKESGTLNILPIRAYYSPKSIANVLSLAEVAASYRVTMDTDNNNSIFVHTDDDILEFRSCKNGLFYLDIDNKTKLTVAPYSFLSTVKGNKQHFSRQELVGADKARRLQSLLSWPSTTDFKKYIRNNFIHNSPVTIDDINRAETIYGPHIALLKGKMTRKTPSYKKDMQVIQLPSILIEHHPHDELNMDFLFVNGKPYLHTKSSKIKLLSIQACRGRGAKELQNGIEKVVKRYTDRGFNINAYRGDNEFEVLRNFVAPAPLQIVGADDHVGTIERSIRTIKERARCTCQSLPYQKMPKIMIDHLLELIVTNLNSFPAKTGISKTLSPAAIVLGTPKIECNNLKLEFGTYVQAHVKSKNNLTTRSVAAICLRPSSTQGGYYFMSLVTGKRIHTSTWTELPIPDLVIERVHELANRQNAQNFIHGYPVFEWSPGVPIDDEQSQKFDESYNEIHNDESSDSDYEFDSEDDESVNSYNDNDEEDDENNDNNDDDDNVYDDDNNDDDDNDIYSEIIDNEDTFSIQSNFETYTENNDQTNAENNSEFLFEEDDTNTQDNTVKKDILDNNIDTEGVERKNIENDMNKRPQRSEEAKKRKDYIPSFGGKTYAQLFQQVRNKTEIEVGEIYRKTVNVIFTQVANDKKEDKQIAPGGTGGPQMSAKKGIEAYGERAVTAIFKEYLQLHDKSVFGSINPDALTIHQKREALRAVNLIKQKRCGKIKGRTCADGRRQRKYISREEAASPTVSNEALLATMIVDAYEGRDVGIFDIPGAYLHADMPKEKFVLLKLEGRFADIMSEVNPNLQRDIRYENGKKVLYLRLLKALYGCIESALLWYNLYTTTLKKLGFILNSYDRCIANKMVKGSQCTIAWYVDDNKISHMSPSVVTAIIKIIEKRFGKLEVSRGRKHNFLGMDIEFKKDGTVSINMKDYIIEASEVFGEDVTINVSSAATGKLFVIDENSPKLENDKSDKFHSIVAKLLWVMKRGRPDIETVISFLCTRVSDPTEEDWDKLRRVLCFLNQTIDDKRILGADSLGKLFVWIDGSHAVHPNMRGHTGGCISFGIGQVVAKASKQKSNTKSSTETEIVATSEFIPYPLHM